MVIADERHRGRVIKSLAEPSQSATGQLAIVARTSRGAVMCSRICSRRDQDACAEPVPRSGEGARTHRPHEGRPIKPAPRYRAELFLHFRKGGNDRLPVRIMKKQKLAKASDPPTICSSCAMVLFQRQIPLRKKLSEFIQHLRCTIPATGRHRRLGRTGIKPAAFQAARHVEGKFSGLTTTPAWTIRVAACSPFRDGFPASAEDVPSVRQEFTRPDGSGSADAKTSSRRVSDPEKTEKFFSRPSWMSGPW